MKTIGILLLTTIVFAVATGTSWWMNKQRLASAQDSETVPANASSSESNSSEMQMLNSIDFEDRIEESIQTKPVTVEEMVRLGMNLKQREKLLEEQAEKLKQQAIHQQIAFAEIQGETVKIEQLRGHVRSELDKADELINRLLQARQALLDEKATAEVKLTEMKDVLTEVDTQHQENTKKLAQWIQSMQPQKAAEVLREMSNDGKIPVAVEILAHLEEREAAKILSELNDAKLVQDLVTEFRNLKSPKQIQRGTRPQR